MKKRSIIAAIAVMFVILFTSALFTQAGTSFSSKDDGIRGTSSGDVSGVYVPD